QHWHYNEDSYLWVRMYLAGCKFANLDEDLVFARINDATFERRGGYKYYKSERDLFKFMKKNKVITGWQYFKAKTIRFIVQVLMPNGVRKWFFKKFARNKQ
ncbi:MAG: glycosyl transferase, partial [Clostridia bacterium]|nr:glycosyl transferase [Clostridia bacterium]